MSLHGTVAEKEEERIRVKRTEQAKLHGLAITLKLRSSLRPANLSDNG
jgi:hypothetical protein